LSTTAEGRFPSKGSVPEVIFFTSQHCAFCKAIRPTVEDIAAAYGNQVTMREVNASREPEVAADWKVRATPTLLAVHGESEIARHVGEGAEGDVRRIFQAAADGASQNDRRISARERVIRLTAAGIVAAVAIGSGTFWLLAVAALLLAAGVYDIRPQSRDSNTLTADETRQLMDSEMPPILVDIRTPAERTSEMIPGSIHIPLGPDFEAKIQDLSDQDNYILYCATGFRSTGALKSLMKNDVSKVRHMTGGLQSWSASGGPVTESVVSQGRGDS
jgi:rhodanese-related sulfurtransferase/thiol-disulfide isomerase/thioredoxin